MTVDIERGRQVQLVLGTLLGALIWLWPYTHGPVSQFWPNVVAWSAGAGLLLLVLDRFNESDRIIATGWLLAASVSAVLALMQYFDVENALLPFVATTVPGYAYANTRQANHLASLLVVGLLAIVWMMRVNRLRWAAHGLGVVLAVGLATTASRGGAVQLLLVGLAVLCWGGERKRQLLMWYALVVSVYAVAVLSLPRVLEFSQGVSGGRNLLDRMAVESTCSSRIVLWRNVLDLIAQKPWTGWGWGELKYGHYMTLYDEPRFCDMLSNAHNLPLHLATELGIPAATFLILGFTAILLWLRPWYAKDPSQQLGWGVLAIVGVHCLLEFPVWFGNFQVMVALALWLVWPAVRIRFSPRSSTALSPVNWWKRLTCLIAIQLLLLGMGWDYFRVSQLYLPYADRWAPFRDNTLEKVRQSVFFRDQVLFAQVVSIQPSQENAATVLEASLETLHISPEPRVIERVIVSASLLGQRDVVDAHVRRYAAAWPADYAIWSAAQQPGTTGAYTRLHSAH